MNPLLRRIVAAMSAGAFGQAVTIAIQLFSLPLFLSRWSAETYGTWLLLTAMPAYLSMADAGIVATAGNRMTMAMGRDEIEHADTIFHSAFAFVSLACLGIALVLVPLALFVPYQGLSGFDQRAAVVALIFSVLLAIFSGLADAIFRATNRYALGMLLGNLIRVAEWVGYMVGLFAFGSFSAVAVCGCLARLVGTLATIHVSAQGEHRLTWGLGKAHLSEIRAMLKPAISFMAFPLANALSFQGITLLVGREFGPAVVAIFNTYRTISRVAVQATGIFGHSLWVEFSSLFGRGGAAAVAAIYRRSFLIGIISSTSLSALLYLMAPILLGFWSRGKIPFVGEPMFLLLIYAALGGIWHVPRVLLLSTNQHFSLAQWALAASLVSVGLVFAVRSTFGLAGVCASMLISELLIAVACSWLAHRMFTTGAQTPPARGAAV